MGHARVFEYRVRMNWTRVVGAVAVVILIGVGAFFLVRYLGGSSDTPETPELPVYTIALDAGHGGRDPGAVVDDVLEKDINLEIVKKLRDLIDAEPGLDVVLTRNLDMFPSLEERIRIAEEGGAVVYISVHANSYPDSGPSGIETIVDDTRANDDDSWVLAELIQNALTDATGARDRGTRSQESYLQRTEMPAVSVETGYLTNPGERAKLVDPVYQQTLADAILVGINEFIGWRYPPVEDETE